MIGDDQAPSEAMIEATRSRIAVVRNFKPKATAIVGHSDLKATSCPGPHVRALLDSGAFEGTFASPPPLSTSPAAPYESPWWTLRIGRRGDGVKWLQWQLQRRAYKVTVDGIFGPKTRRHLKKYQRVVGLVPDGIAGPKTIRALGA
jgi:hypothetical protein